MAMAIAPVIHWVVVLLAPITGVISKFVRLVLRLFGHDVDLVAVGSHLELLRGAIEMHRGGGENEFEIIKKERDMLRSILDLNDVDVGEVMSHRKNVEMMDAAMSNKQIIDKALNSPYTRLPIYQDDPDNIVGVMHAKLLLRQLRTYDGDIEDLDIITMVSEPWFIPETTTLFDQLQAFRDRREHFAVVVDEYGSVMGVVTLEDILEEIVGEIDDEHDVVVEGVKADVTGQGYIIDGTATIRDLNREFEWSLPDENYATLAGLILYESKTLPQVGQVFSYYGFRFEIITRQRNQITSVRVTPVSLDESQ
jgi:Mg2+/Co2+ transporter CorB